MGSNRNFHEGEAKLQAESGVDTEVFDQMVDQAFRPELSAAEVRFVGSRTFSVAASLDAEGRPWASPLFPNADELFRVDGPTEVRVTAQAVEGDPLLDNVAATGELGVLYFDPSLRRRAKSLGQGSVEADGSITYRMHRNFGLCNKYIFKRSHQADVDAVRSDRPSPTVAPSLGAQDREQLETADTIFFASHHTTHGADATHRGGPAGFVTIIDEATVSIPDYAGNGMFQTLGNLLLNDRIGILAVDFVSGRTVQLTGRGRIEPSPDEDPMSVRTLVVDVEQVRTTWPNVGQWTDIEAFDATPGLLNPATPYR